MNDIELAERIVSQCERMGINLCSDFESWTNIAFALSTLGEAGRPLFHRLARMDEAYRENENDRKFTNAMRTNRGINLATLIFRAKCNGVDIASLKDEDTRSIEWHRVTPQRKITPPADNIPMSLIERSEGARNGLCEYLSTITAQDNLKAVIARYHLGSSQKGETIFPQIDTAGRCRTGKVIPYDPTTGHRIKERGADWLHARFMRMNGKEASCYNLRQCLFGEHLLPHSPDAPVCLVESEKSALVCAMKFPDFVWVATGGKQNFKEEMLQPLAVRRVVVYADADATADWREKLQRIPFAATWTLSDWAKNEPADSKRDIADLVLEYMKLHPEAMRQHPLTPEEILARMKRKNPALALLWEKGNFELVAV